MGTESLNEMELLVMLALLRLGTKGSDPTTIAEDIRDRTGRGVRRANVHATLHRLQDKGFVSGVETPAASKGRAKIKIELEGIAAVRATTEGILTILAKFDVEPEK